jgi:hypothetical protein
MLVPPSFPLSLLARERGNANRLAPFDILFGCLNAPPLANGPTLPTFSPLQKALVLPKLTSLDCR